eukprot:4690475-Pyramimonas_sp.AAC.1
MLLPYSSAAVPSLCPCYALKSFGACILYVAMAHLQRIPKSRCNVCYLLNCDYPLVPNSSIAIVLVPSSFPPPARLAVP